MAEPAPVAPPDGDGGPAAATVYVLVEEVEVGSVSGETYWILGAYGSERRAEDAREVERSGHEFDDDEDEGGDWCICHGRSWRIVDVEVQP